MSVHDSNDRRPNVLFVMTDQQRHDTIGALGNPDIHTPNLDRLADRGAAFTNGYTTSPVCMPARYTLISGCEPPTTGIHSLTPYPDMHTSVEERCGPYLPERMRQLGYRTFGVGKFHTIPWDADIGFDVVLHSEVSMWKVFPEVPMGDLMPKEPPPSSWGDFIAKNHPEYRWLESYVGEFAEMYYVPQMSPLPAHLTETAWAVDRAIELIEVEDDRPWFGFVSVREPHNPFVPPPPFNRMYDPDRLPSPVLGDPAIDHMDQYIPLMNRICWADDISDSQARLNKARYYGEITHIDRCLGRLLDTLEATGEADNTVICFVSDHGEHLGDHHAWHKDSFFESSARIPFLVSWPERIPVGRRSDLVCLADLFGLATAAAGAPEPREGIDLLGVLTAGSPGREALCGYHGNTVRNFKFMVRRDQWKLIYFVNGGMTQLFHIESDPDELEELSSSYPELVRELIEIGLAPLVRAGRHEFLDGDRPLALPYQDWRTSLEESPWTQGGASERLMWHRPPFPDHPGDILGAPAAQLGDP